MKVYSLMPFTCLTAEIGTRAQTVLKIEFDAYLKKFSFLVQKAALSWN